MATAGEGQPLEGETPKLDASARPLLLCGRLPSPAKPTLSGVDVIEPVSRSAVASKAHDTPLRLVTVALVAHQWPLSRKRAGTWPPVKGWGGGVAGRGAQGDERAPVIGERRDRKGGSTDGAQALQTGALVLW